MVRIQCEGVCYVIDKTGYQHWHGGAKKIVEATEISRRPQVHGEFFKCLTNGSLLWRFVCVIESAARKADISRPGVTFMFGTNDKKDFRRGCSLFDKHGNGGMTALAGLLKEWRVTGELSFDCCEVQILNCVHLNRCD